MNKNKNSGEVGSQDNSMSGSRPKDPNADIYENRGTKKIIRVVTVIAYLFSVSFVGILLSVYYLFLWEPPIAELIERARLRTNPEMQFLRAEPSLITDEIKDSKTKEYLSKNESNSTYNKALLHHVTQDIFDGEYIDMMNSDKQKKLNGMLLKLRHSLIDAIQAQNRSLLHEVISNDFDNTSVKLKKSLELTENVNETENSFLRHNESRKNISEWKIQNRSKADVISKFEGFTNVMSNLNASSTLNGATIPVIELKRNHSDRKFVPERNSSEPIINHKKGNQDYKKKMNTTRLYSIHKSNNTKVKNLTNNNYNNRVSKDNNSPKIIKKLRVDILNDKKRSMKERKIVDCQVITNSDREKLNNSRDLHATPITPGDIIENRNNNSLLVNVSLNSTEQNSTTNNGCLSNVNHTTQITGNVLTIRLSHDVTSTDDSRFKNQPSDDSVVKRRYVITNPEGERICVDF